MMSLQITPPTLIVLLIVNGVGAQDEWSVDYNPESICALKGSTVIMGCTYTFPNGSTVQKTFWSKELVRPGYEPLHLSVDPEYRGRVHYLGDKLNNCRLRLRDLRETDQRKYYFRFITDKPGGKYQGPGGVALSVTGLQVEGPERVMEGDDFTLTCNTSCRLTDRPFIWYRNGASLSSRTEQLYLQRVSREDAGRYSCAVLDQNLHSPEVTLNVLYPPESVSVSISPSGGIVEGSSVTLTCSSDGNPPVQKYTWFKEVDEEVQQKWTGQIYSITNIRSADSGGYWCMATNTHGSRYSEYKSLNVQYPPKSVSVSISLSGGIVEGSSVTLTCSSDGNPPVQNYTWFKDGGSSPVGSGHSYSFTLDSKSSGRYYCEAQNEHGSERSDAVLINFKENITIYVIGGVGVGCAGPILILVVLFIRKKKERKKVEKLDYQNTDPNAQDDIYISLDTRSRSSDDVYHTLATVHSSPSDDVYHTLANADPNAQDDTYTALDTRSRSSDDVYHTLATVHSRSSDDVYSALDPQ